MVGWKKLLVLAAGFGGGFAVVLASIVAGWAWYQSRPERPKPWDEKAIIATFDYPDTGSGEPEGPEGFRPDTLILHYTLENTTDHDYHMPPKEQLELDARLKRERSLSGGSSLNTLDKDPVFIPAKQRRRFDVLQRPERLRQLRSIIGSMSVKNK
jgi:hypothetical protein